MKTFKAIIVGAALLSDAQAALACEDPVLRTNTEPRVRLRRYQESMTDGMKKPSRPQPGEDRGAAVLRVPKEACFLYPNLRSQYDIPCLAPLVRAYDALPKETRRLETFRDGKRVNLAVQMVGTGSHETVLICIPGVMGDHLEFRFVVGALAAEYDFWLVDPPGCGDSDKPDPQLLGRGGYSPAAMAERELQVIQRLLDERQKPVRPVILAHSLGGLVTLRAFSDPELRARYGGVLNRVEGLVLLAPCDVVMSQVNPSLSSRADLSGLTVGLGNGLGVVRERVAQYLAGCFYDTHCLSREEVDHAVEVISNPATRKAFQAMLREALPFDEKTRQPIFSEMMRLETWYTNVTLPCQIIWGKRDQTLPVAMGYMLEKQLPNARLTVIPDFQHAPNLESPRECARLIQEAHRQIVMAR